MKTKTLIKRTEKEKKTAKIVLTLIFTITFFAIFGLIIIVNDITSLTSCNGTYSCLVKILGDFGLYLLSILLVTLISYFASTLIVSDYKEKKRK